MCFQHSETAKPTSFYIPIKGDVPLVSVLPFCNESGTGHPNPRRINFGPIHTDMLGLLTRSKTMSSLRSCAPTRTRPYAVRTKCTVKSLHPQANC